MYTYASKDKDYLTRTFCAYKGDEVLFIITVSRFDWKDKNDKFEWRLFTSYLDKYTYNKNSLLHFSKEIDVNDLEQRQQLKQLLKLTDYAKTKNACTTN